MIKFIVDAQLPKRIADFLIDNGYDSIHTLDLENKNRTKDKEIIENSIQENRIVIAKDYDFLESFILKEEPQKLIIVKTGNISNNELMKLFSTYLDTIIKMITGSNLVEIHKDKIIEQ
ncbi:MAG: DUF5615 family PIN-like protein [Ekhidna sp.]|nr:DUF5615 family PIN-like protein [Ekhidna sp.]